MRGKCFARAYAYASENGEEKSNGNECQNEHMEDDLFVFHFAHQKIPLNEPIMAMAIRMAEKVSPIRMGRDAINAVRKI